MLASSKLVRRAAGSLCTRTAAVVPLTGLGRKALQQAQRHGSATECRTYSNQYGDVSTQPAAPVGPGGAGAPGVPPVFISFDVYKSRGAMTIKPIMPTWDTLQNGGFKIKREGVFYIEMAPASGAGDRTYSWDKKAALALSCIEVAGILAEPNKEHSFYHDPNKGRAGEGQVQKTFKWTPAADGNVYFVNASVRDRNLNTDFSASSTVSHAELYMFKCLAEYAIPRLCGWHDKFAQEGQ